MQSNLKSGLSTLQIIIILTVIAFIIGLVATLNSAGDTELVTQSNSDAVSGESGLENIAQNIAEAQAEPVTEAVNERNEQVEAEMEVDVTSPGTSDLAAVSEITPTPPSAEVATTPGTFETYSPEKLALANNGTVVLFFHADWCPSCRGLENDLNARLGEISNNTHILKLDYDTETELKRRYEVIRQHTLVVVDADGTELKKLTGLTNTLDQVVDQL